MFFIDVTKFPILNHKWNVLNNPWHLSQWYFCGRTYAEHWQMAWHRKGTRTLPQIMMIKVYTWWCCVTMASRFPCNNSNETTLCKPTLNQCWWIVDRPQGTKHRSCLSQNCVKYTISVGGMPRKAQRNRCNIAMKQATGLDAWASRVKCPARFVSHLHDICIYIWVVYSFCLVCCLFIIVTTQFVAWYKPCKPKPKPSTYDPPDNHPLAEIQRPMLRPEPKQQICHQHAKTDHFGE